MEPAFGNWCKRAFYTPDTFAEANQRHQRATTSAAQQQQQRLYDWQKMTSNQLTAERNS